MNNNKWCDCNEFPMKHRHASFKGSVKAGAADAQHTQTPWTYVGNGPEEAIIYKSGDRFPIARIRSLNPMTDASFIIRAVNSHDMLLSAAKEALSAMREKMKGPGFEYAANAVYHLSAAIAKAESVSSKDSTEGH